MPSQTPPTNPPMFGLRLAAARVQGFRSLRDLHLTFTTGTTVLIGENNSGKTSLLEALAVAFGQLRAELNDLFKDTGSRVEEFQIDLRIEPTDGDEFPEHVSNIIGDNVQIDVKTLEPEPDYFTIRARGTVSGQDISIRRTFIKGWANNASEAKALKELRPVDRRTMELLHFDMLDARRDIVEQLRNRRSHWGRTTSSVNISETDRSKLEDSLKELGDSVTSKSKVLSQVREDLTALSTALSQGQLNVELEALPRKVDDLIRAMDIAVTSPNSATFPIGNQGMGTRSLAALLVFRSYVNVVRAQSAADSSLSVAAFEEPEAHLHPQSQRSVFGLLSQIGGQRIVSTHSAFVASVAEIGAYRMFRREGASSTVTELSPKQLGELDTEHVRRFIKIENPEVLFAKAVGLVEGATELAAFPIFARHYWGEHGADGVGVTLLSTGGAKSSKHFIPFLDALGIPWIIFADGDPAGDAGLKANDKLLGRPLSRSSQEVVQLPVGQAYEHSLSDYVAEIREAVDAHPDGTLEKFMKGLHGKPRNEKEKWEFSGPDREWKGAFVFMQKHKGTIGGLVATSICQAIARGDAKIPPHITEFFERLDKIRQH